MSRAICAMTGAAPVPVPPPMPAVTNTMSAPSSDFGDALALSSSAASRPISGLAPAPRPLVSVVAELDLDAGARFASSAWQSVLAAMNSTPSRLPLDHRVDRVAAAAADADHLDDGTTGTLGIVVELEHGKSSSPSIP